MTRRPDLAALWPLILLLALLVACVAVAPSGRLAALPAGDALAAPSLAHPFGTDDLGRDMLAALAQGGRTSLAVAAATAAMVLGLGGAIGLVAGLGPRPLDEAMMRLADMVAGLPALLFAILVASLFGGSIVNLALVLGLTRWPVVARLVRAETLTLRQAEFVRAAKALGATTLAVGRRHVLPHALRAALPSTGIVFGGAILAEAAMAFVGLGDPAATSWGQLVAAGYGFVATAWWMWAFPAGAIVACAALVALAADGAGRPLLRDAGYG